MICLGCLRKISGEHQWQNSEIFTFHLRLWQVTHSMQFGLKLWTVSVPPEQTLHQNLKTFHSCHPNACGSPEAIINIEKQTKQKRKVYQLQLNFWWITKTSGCGTNDQCVQFMMLSLLLDVLDQALGRESWRVSFFMGSFWRVSPSPKMGTTLLCFLAPSGLFPLTRESWGRPSWRWQPHQHLSHHTQTWFCK